MSFDRTSVPTELDSDSVGKLIHSVKRRLKNDSSPNILSCWQKTAIKLEMCSKNFIPAKFVGYILELSSPFSGIKKIF
jgi:hypothetical protein